MQQNLRILSQSNCYNGGENRSDRSHNSRANSSRRSNSVSDTYGVEVARFNRTSRSTDPQGRDDADSKVNRSNLNNFASRSTGLHARDGSNSNRNHSNFGSRRSSGPQVQNNSNFHTRNNNSGNYGSISSGRSGRVHFCNEDATRRSTGTPVWGNSASNNATTRSNGTSVWGNSASNNAAVRATGSSAWNNAVTTSRSTRGWGSSMLKNVATKSNNVTARSTTAKNKADSSFAEPSPSKKK